MATSDGPASKCTYGVGWGVCPAVYGTRTTTFAKNNHLFYLHPTTIHPCMEACKLRVDICWYYFVTGQWPMQINILILFDTSHHHHHTKTKTPTVTTTRPHHITHHRDYHKSSRGDPVVRLAGSKNPGTV